MLTKLSLDYLDKFIYISFEVLKVLTTGERIKHARQSASLTVKKLSKFISVTERSILRYESNQSMPDTHTLIQLACIFDLSTDYLLCISDNPKTSFLDKYRYNNIYYQNVCSNVPINDKVYYWVEYMPQKEAYPMRGQMQWAGFNDKGEELYCLRPINIENCLRLFVSNLFSKRPKPLIVNKSEDFYVFLLYGGTAFVTEDVCKECLKHLIRPETVIK